MIALTSFSWLKKFAPLEHIYRVFRIIGAERRGSLVMLCALTIITAIVDSVGVASIFPFITFITGNESETFDVLIDLYESVYPSPTWADQVTAMGAITLFILLLSQTLRAISSYAQLKFVFGCEAFVASRLLGKYLDQPYGWHLGVRGSDLSGKILTDVGLVIGGVIMPMVNAFSQLCILFGILLVLSLVNFYATVVIFVSTCFIYFAIYMTSKKVISSVSLQRDQSNKLRYSVISESFAAIKLIKLRQSANLFLSDFGLAATSYAAAHTHVQILSSMPRYLIETLLFGGMVIVGVYYASSHGSGNGAFPILAIYAFAGYRLMPAIQQIYASATQLQFALPALVDIDKALSVTQPNISTKPRSGPRLSFTSLFQFDSIYFSYQGAKQFALSDISFSIRKGQAVGVVGPTGSGKSTFIDVMAGLLEPSRGRLILDGRQLDQEDILTWQRSIGYVPQTIRLSSGSVEQNIAFGVSPLDIDRDLVVECAKVACAHQFIEMDLPEGYKTDVGEFGARLSGGQRQLIGIARALYFKPDLLILDEATSALDQDKEREVMQSIFRKLRDVTKVIIAHRILSLRDANSIVFLQDGRLKRVSSFEEMIEEARLYLPEQAFKNE